MKARLVPALLASSALPGCVTLSETTVAPLPCQARVWPTPFADLIPREPKRGVCIRARLQQHPD
ncbi:hypothetical protein ACRAQ6_13900 [Erythrobacter sp. HA6-11]